MNVGIIKFSLQLPGNQSLKGKRKIIKSLCQKIRNTFEVSVAEVASNDDLKYAVIGISVVSNDPRVLQQVIAQILSFLQNYMGDFVLQDFSQDIVTGY